MTMDLTPIWISLKTAFVSTIITFFIGILIAQLMNKYQGRLKGLFDSILTLPLVLPPTVVGFFLLLIFGKNGPFKTILEKLDTQIIFSWSATVLAAVVVTFPLMYRTARGAFEQIDSNVSNAARTLGASEWTIFWKVTVPLAWPGIAAGTILSFTRALGEFGATLMIAGNIPGKTQTIPVAIFFAAEGGEMDKALMWVLLIVGISFTVIILMNYWSEYQGKYLSKKRGKNYGVIS
ncbi:molybdate transport system permease protein [Clostridium intestinale DSM 6191]|uniref:Molybdenum transport system permease n=2 Tax=Clostridium intestinale TaxID=36845 RepID=A0A1M5XK68_9CLOT|nr:molybdate ABC transporter permease subunit [Clostridium intestinale]WRY49690.1 molybdate ABC transporter permease subunit [Clostridium intestinale]SHI00146.1 molybdate transport system permease protein [Clostridium intestinale DSM 6191]